MRCFMVARGPAHQSPFTRTPVARPFLSRTISRGGVRAAHSWRHDRGSEHEQIEIQCADSVGVRGKLVRGEALPPQIG
jgi:hypothetical protein